LKDIKTMYAAYMNQEIAYAAVLLTGTNSYEKIEEQIFRLDPDLFQMLHDHNKWTYDRYFLADMMGHLDTVKRGWVASKASVGVKRQKAESDLYLALENPYVGPASFMWDAQPLVELKKKIPDLKYLNLSEIEDVYNRKKNDIKPHISH
jgi:hypothetical protein